VEKVQIRATKLKQDIKHLSDIDRLKYLNRPTLLYQRFRGDMIMVFKRLAGTYNSNIACLLFKLDDFAPSQTVIKGTFFMICVKICFGNRIMSN
jgi:hypothetical protein